MGIKIRMTVHKDGNENWIEDGDMERRIKTRIRINKMQMTFNAHGCLKHEPIKFKNCFS